MLKGAHLVLGYEFEDDAETVFTEEHIYLIDLTDDLNETEDSVFWDAVAEIFEQISPVLASKKNVQYPGYSDEVNLILFHRNIRNISNVGVTSEGFNSEMTTPLLITSRSFVFKDRDKFFEYANGINVDVDTDDPIHVQALGL